MAVAPKQSAEGNASKISRKRVILWVSIFLVVVFCLAPVLWQLLTSFKINDAISAVPNVYFPSFDQLTLNHYMAVFTGHPFARYMFNSAFVAFCATILCLATGAPAAYALARLRIPGHRIYVAGVLIVVLFPYVLLFLGLFEVVQAFGIGNNYLALIIPYTGRNLPLTILVMRSFFSQLPKDLEDSAKVDGYNTVQMLIRIVLPMTVPALVTTGILAFIFSWNEYIFALTFVTRETMKTLPVGIAQLGAQTVFEIPYGPIAAATIAGTIPLILLVLFFQRRIVQGLTAGAVKG
ncbi:MAG: sugar ABC transporter [Cyanobacteria bacterium SW_6_48_11]|nr:MAG: sugar ABC transporter [Cyanobacteria bacterium QS_4_48_99]PSO82553.1 MAG: sugar ABC transporter [Cyanobacteria bacterium QS_5_48_63]PSO88959.1 MAG: sugar ABC transporter [Cyanobacteria bacterium QS_3_48_167]PSO91939.1 MAG: sugar ABC transporter [Cyanobacteria bacterium QS_6_48_18]PSO98164.1 MAG: sugar ABC transporter [Cyanobacteria bacterium SW_6_48_11]PSP04630.1 MAG: sugar ABC transporter [Cyanobacteria bacterium SW_12_48_29]PSP06650.1 MAG: sugar ABC transporter [Cyanobacteria bacter